ncbi:MAG: ATP-binding protein [Phascolarctobacterium sp.]
MLILYAGEVRVGTDKNEKILRRKWGSKVDQHFNKIGEVHTMLQEARIGLWCVEYDDNKAPRLYADDTFLSMMGIDKGLSPEEGYRLWEDQIPSYEKERASAYMQNMMQGEHSEIEYAWQHPTKGLMFIRCCGDLDPAYTEGIRVHGCHQDITDVVQIQQNIESKLKATEQSYAKLNKANQQKQDILNTIPGGVAVIKCDEHGVWAPEFMSQGFADIFGMRMEQLWALYKEDAMAGVHPDDRSRLSHELGAYLQGGQEAAEFVYRLVRADGSYVWVRNTLNSLPTEDGLRRNFCVYRDITKELEEKEELRSKYRELLSTSYYGLGHDMLLVGHCNISQNKMLEVIDNQNKDLLGKLGYERETFIRFVGQFIVDAEERQEYLKFALNAPLLEAYAQGKREVSHVYFVKSPLEKYGRYAQFKVTMMQNPDTDDIMGVLSIMDATEQTINRKIVRKMSVLGADRITDIDLVHGTRTVLYAANVHSPLIGRKGKISDFLERSLERHVAPEDRELWLEHLQPDYIRKALADKDSYSFTYSVYKNKNFPPKVKMATVTAIDMRLGRVCMARTDITASVEAERRSKEALEAALAEAERANRAKSEFLSNVSHDIRTPMNAIMGMTSIAMNNLQNPQGLRDCLDKIVISSKHLLGLINNVLDMSKIEAGKLVLNKEQVSLRSLVSGIVTTIQGQIQAKEQELVLDIGRLECATVLSDGVRLQQVLLNLLGNAVKFTPTGGRVEFSLHQKPSPKGASMVRLYFGVRDNGIGMTPDFVKHIFESFAREDNRRVQKIEGTGLGMAITKYIVDAMGGTIVVHSKPNEGTDFQIVLDVERGKTCGQHKEAAADAAKHEVNVAGLRVLLAEDNELNQEIAKALLERQGISVETADNGQICVDKFTASQVGYYDAILMDLRMPVMNGYEATRAIRALVRDDAKLPIIAMTADAFAEDMQHCLAAGMTAHMAKPMDVEKLMNLLGQVCGK